MTMMRRFLLVFIFFSACAQVWAQSQESRFLKTELDSLAERLAGIHAGQQLMSKRADSVAQAISRLKSRPASPLETRSLNEAYRASQIVADSLQGLQNRGQTMDRRLRQKAEALLKNLNTEMAAMAEAKTAAQKQRDRNAGQRLNQEIQSCRQWQKICRQILDEPPPPVLIYEVRIAPDDDARTLQSKADFLRDQADRVERELRAYDHKLAAMREETTLRQRLQEFSQELALFDPANEGLRARERDEAAGLASRTDNIPVLESSAAQSFNSRASVEPLISFNWPGNVSDLSDQDLRAWQKRLQQWRVQRQAQADSLRRRAGEIEDLSRAKEE